MHRFPVFNYSRFDELPFKTLHEQQFAIYILDFSGNFIFVNTFACEYLKKESKDLIGKNAWPIFNQYVSDTDSNALKINIETKVVSNLTAVSQTSGGDTVSIINYPMEDCDYISINVFTVKNTAKHLLANLEDDKKFGES